MGQQNETHRQTLLDISTNSGSVMKRGNSKGKKIVTLTIIVLIIALATGIFIYWYRQNAKREAMYKDATTALETGNFEVAISLFGELGDYKDSAFMVQNAQHEALYVDATASMENGDYETAINLFTELGDYKDSPHMIQECYDAQSLDYLQTIYRGIDTIYRQDNELAKVVSTAIKNVDTVNSANTKLQTRTNWAISSLYNGEGHRAFANCSAYDLAGIKAYFPSAHVTKGKYYYDVYVPIFSVETAQAFVDNIASANTLMKELEDGISTDSLSATHREIQDQLLLAYDALKEYHSFVANEPTDWENYNATVTQKKTAVSNLLKNLPSIVKAGG